MQCVHMHATGRRRPPTSGARAMRMPACAGLPHVATVQLVELSFGSSNSGHVLHRHIKMVPSPGDSAHVCRSQSYWPPAAGRLGVSMKPCLRPSKPARSSLFSRCREGRAVVRGCEHGGDWTWGGALCRQDGCVPCASMRNVHEGRRHHGAACGSTPSGMHNAPTPAGSPAHICAHLLLLLVLLGLDARVDVVTPPAMGGKRHKLCERCMWLCSTYSAVQPAA